MDQHFPVAVKKACPVVLRRRDEVEILAFIHPLAGRQLVKGTVEPGETVEAAAARELCEEAGIAGTQVTNRLGDAEIDAGQRWHFLRMAVAELPDGWTHHCEDDSGHDFVFFWHPLASEPGSDWHPVFQRALAYIRNCLVE
jgi:8-oxo-dGTP pyrophosphatase MutT (NUDIX family)